MNWPTAHSASPAGFEAASEKKPRVLTMLWWNGRLGKDFEVSRIFVVAIAPYVLWVRFYLDGVTAQAMDAFRLVLAVSDEEFSRLRYELTTLPAPLKTDRDDHGDRRLRPERTAE